MSKPSDVLFQEIQNDLASIKSKVTQLRGLDLTENERILTDHVENIIRGFDAVETFQPRREPSAEQARLDANIRERQRISKL